MGDEQKLEQCNQLFGRGRRGRLAASSGNSQILDGRCQARRPDVSINLGG